MTDEVYCGEIEGGRPPEVLFRAPARVRYAEPGYLLFMQGDTLRAIKFDVRSEQAGGGPAHHGERRGVKRSIRLGDVHHLANRCISISAWSQTRLSRLTWLDRSGRTLSTVGEPANYINPALSPDERRPRDRHPRPTDQQAGHLGVRPDSRDANPVHFRTGRGSRRPVFSPDGAQIAFVSDRTGQRKLYFKQTSGSGDEKQALEANVNSVHSWSADGRSVLVDQFRELPDRRHPFPRSLLIAGEAVARFWRQVRTRANRASRLTARWVAYSSNESGRREVHVQSFPPGKGKWQISTEGGVEPQWRGDGKELFYMSPTR